MSLRTPALLSALLLSACSAPGAELIDSPLVDELRTGQRSGTQSFDHSALDTLLSTHVNAEAGHVDYQGLSDDRAELDAYLSALAEIDATAFDEDEQLAMLINAYNACTLRLIVDNLPVDSIRDIDDPWGKPRCEVAGYTLSLDEIEHGLIRPLYQDPRIHFAVNCAARSCPHLAESAYTGAQINAQLDARTRASLSDPKFARIEGDTLYLTKIMDWYGGDFIDPAFEGSTTELVDYVELYTTEAIRARLQDDDASPVNIVFMDYDWSLNSP
ncbi:DUF547 domain-containing protein [Lujinxingia vulgaris]|uniref:DUF547 domain-containing protein n=1 Tax=Lujinxingia vulgaris TaxID=2600176 RepID=A0A5C6X9L6_9DELT|nr:DUF547 domain-containing protein [Lujinxingia vulgaris]TXD37076.1 DUF547 domain-containing protein [Lujinxingia vulgaris]